MSSQLLYRSFNSYIDYPTRGESYEIQHEDFHNTDRPNTFLAYGALVGGPGAEDTYASSLRAWAVASEPLGSLPTPCLNQAECPQYTQPACRVLCVLCEAGACLRLCRARKA